MISGARTVITTAILFLAIGLTVGYAAKANMMYKLGRYSRWIKPPTEEEKTPHWWPFRDVIETRHPDAYIVPRRSAS